jgi:hypothetical protein
MNEREETIREQGKVRLEICGDLRKTSDRSLFLRNSGEFFVDLRSRSLGSRN